jgi:MYXO-CTERM domain-containing protein
MSLTSRLSPLVVAASAAAAFTFFSARDAHAGIEACNNINVSASAVCKVEAQGGCTAQCTPVKMEVACAAKLEASCTGQCNAAIDASCTGSCQGTCEGQCSANPGSLDCSANCKATCEGNCSGKCSAAGNKAECEASCKATCGGSCDAKCEGTPPSATCQAKCQASCNGSCQAKANLDCQISCQSKGYASCKTELEGGCKAKCTQPEGALFCDGQYVDAGNNLKNCIDALNAYLKVKVSGSAQCSGNECSAEGKASASCAAAPGDEALNPAWLGIGVAAIAGSALRRRRRQ